MSKSVPEVKEKFILDATAGYRMMHYNKKHPNVLYIDQRPECEPDEIQDFTNLPYVDKRFKLIIFDPPHFVKREKILTTAMVRRFGMLEAETWQHDIKKAFKELWRVLDDYGVLIFKWSNHQIASHEIIKLCPVKPIVYQISMNRHRKGSKSGSDEVQTLWFTFMKIPEASI